MSVRTFRLCLAGLALLALAIVGVSILPTFLEDYDGWDIFSSVPQEMDESVRLFINPDDMLAPRDQETISELVEQGRRYGIPWAVAVVNGATIEPGVEPQAYAETLFSDLEVESRDGADDGMLMVVVIPEEDHTATTVHFAVGEAFYPKGGITPERLQWIVDVQMAPMIADNTIGDAIIEGATWVEWMQLFQPAPNPPPTNLEMGLQRLLHPVGSVAVAGLTLLIAGAAIAVSVLTRRGTTPEGSISVDVINATALAQGRVNHQVIVGVVVEAIDRNILVHAPAGFMLAPHDDVQPGSRFDEEITQAMQELAQGRDSVSPARLIRYLRATGLPRRLEDELARGGLMHPRSPLFHLALRIMAVAGSLLGITGLVLAVLGEVDSTLIAAIALTAMSISVLIWNEFRPWTTSAGRAALTLWLLHHQLPENRDRQLFETVRQLDDADPSMPEAALTDQHPSVTHESLRPS